MKRNPQGMNSALRAGLVPLRRRALVAVSSSGALAAGGSWALCEPADATSQQQADPKARAPKPPPCKETICSSKKDALRSMLAAQKPGPSSPAAPCPPDREELGRHTWTLVSAPATLPCLPMCFHAPACAPPQMHTLAAYFPEQPTASDREAAAAFLRVLGALYPCSHCAEDFRDALAESPPRSAPPPITLQLQC
jgi:hypothetical protein